MRGLESAHLLGMRQRYHHRLRSGFSLGSFLMMPLAVHQIRLPGVPLANQLGYQNAPLHTPQASPHISGFVES